MFIKFLLFGLLASAALAEEEEEDGERQGLNVKLNTLFGQRPKGYIRPTGPPRTTRAPTTSTTTLSYEQPISLNKCLGDNEECVPYYLCVNGTINRDGTNIITPRMGKRDCVDVFEQCCKTRDILPERPKRLNALETPTSSVGASPSREDLSRCGVRNPDGVGYFRISGFTNGEAEYGEFPWMMAILKQESAGGKILHIYQCGGSLIHPSVVVTAAHCLNGKDPSSLKVRAGEWDTQTNNEFHPHSDHEVEEIIIHSKYYRGALHNDIALLFLKTPAKLQPNIRTICLPPQDMNFDHSQCLSSGWGKDTFGKEGRYQVILKKVELPIVPSNTCQDNLRTTRLGKWYNLHQSFICAGGEPGKDMCKGDGGSPLVCPVKGKTDQYYQAGIVSWGMGCGDNNIPGVYVNVAGFRNWIDEQLGAHGFQADSYTV